MAIAIEDPVKILTVSEGGNWNLKWPVSNTELQFSIYQEFNTFNFFFILYNMKQTNKQKNLKIIFKQMLRDSAILIQIYF